MTFPKQLFYYRLRPLYILGYSRCRK